MHPFDLRTLFPSLVHHLLPSPPCPTIPTNYHPAGLESSIKVRTTRSGFVPPSKRPAATRLLISSQQVDTKVTPARAIWVHPYEDAQFLNEHPDIRDRLAKYGGGKPTTNESPPPYDAPRRHSFSGHPVPGPSGDAIRPSASQPGTPSDDTRDGRKHRGFFGKLKDKAIGTKEEREAARRQEALVSRRYFLLQSYV